jgi:hypothetical protein
MLEATQSLPRNHPSLYISGAAITLALYRARQAVKDALRRKGEKVSSFPACEITTMAMAYLAEHRELMVEARATVERWTLEGVFGKRAQRAFANIRTLARRRQQLVPATVARMRAGFAGAKDGNSRATDGEKMTPAKAARADAILAASRCNQHEQETPDVRVLYTPY